MRSARVNRSISKPASWQNIPQGESLKEACQTVCNDLASRMFGYHLVKIGNLSSAIELPECPIRHQVALSTPPVQTPSSTKTQKPESVTFTKCDAHIENTQLPLQENAVDAFFLSFELDFSSDPHRVLRELDYSITSSGMVLLCCLNPWSLAGLNKLLPFARKHPLKSARFFSKMRVKDWLNLLHYEVVEERCFYHKAMFNNYKLPIGDKPAHWFKKVLGPYFGWSGSVYCVLAKKQTIPMTTVKNKWIPKPRFVAVSAASSNAAEPISRASREAHLRVVRE